MTVFKTTFIPEQEVIDAVTGAGSCYDVLNPGQRSLWAIVVARDMGLLKNLATRYDRIRSCFVVVGIWESLTGRVRG